MRHTLWYSTLHGTRNLQRAEIRLESGYLELGYHLLPNADWFQPFPRQQHERTPLPARTRKLSFSQGHQRVVPGFILFESVSIIRPSKTAFHWGIDKSSVFARAFGPEGFPGWQRFWKYNKLLAIESREFGRDKYKEYQVAGMRKVEVICQA